MAKLDITDLTGDALFAALKGPQKITVKKTKTPKVPEVQPYKSLGWDIDSLVLLVTHHYCTRCSNKWTVPNRDILIKRIHKKYGIHYAPLTIVSEEPATIFSGIAMVTEREDEEHTFCDQCWDLKSVIEAHRDGQENSEEALPKTEAIALSGGDGDQIPIPDTGAHPLD